MAQLLTLHHRVKKTKKNTRGSTLSSSIPAFPSLNLLIENSWRLLCFFLLYNSTTRSAPFNQFCYAVKNKQRTCTLSHTHPCAINVIFKQYPLIIHHATQSMEHQSRLKMVLTLNKNKMQYIGFDTCGKLGNIKTIDLTMSVCNTHCRHCR